MNIPLVDIFYSEYKASVNWLVLDELSVCLDRKLLLLEEIPVFTRDDFISRLHTIKVSEGLGPQGRGHMLLKEMAKEWLLKNYNLKSRTEVYFAGLHPDVLSNDFIGIIECGNTDPACMPIYMAEPSIIWVGALSYPYINSPNIILYRFIKTDKYLSFLISKKNKLKNMVNQIRNNK